MSGFGKTLMEVVRNYFDLDNAFPVRIYTLVMSNGFGKWKEYS